MQYCDQRTRNFGLAVVNQTNPRMGASSATQLIITEANPNQ